MTTYNIDFPIIDLSTGRYGNRVCFGSSAVKVNPRNEIGKFGIRTHAGLTRLFHQTLKIQGKGDCEKTFYLNKKSAVKWIQSVSKDEKISNASSDAAVIGKIQTILRSSPLNNKQTSVNEHSLSKINALRGNFWRKFFNFTKESWIRFKARFFLFKPSENTLKRSSEMAAITQYFAAKRNVFAYREFLGKDKQTPKRFCEIPTTSKDNYIKPSMASEDHGRGLYQRSLIPTGSKNDTSTGTTGEPTQWYRGPAEQKSVEQLSSYAAKAILGNQPYYFINGFALGQWASGLTAFAATRNDPNATVSSPGMDVRKILNCIKQATHIMPAGYPIVVAGYPPHLREVVELAIQENFDLSQHNIIAVVGGEGISEGQRDLVVCQKEGENVIRQGFRQCYSTYGASDLDVNIGYESEFEIELRKICHINSGLAAELFDNNGSIPMIFHYDPLNYHIETNEEQHLIFTCVREDRISPRIRYDLGDKGKVMTCSDLVATLKKYGVTLRHMPRTELPFVFVWGRGDSMISYRGANVSPENLGEAIRRAGLNEKISHYAFFQYEENDTTMTEFMIEPKKGEALPQNLLETLVNQMKEINPDFKKQVEECRDEAAKPRLRFFEPETSPMAAQRTRYPYAKKKYIFVEKENDEFTPNHRVLGGQLIIT